MVNKEFCFHGTWKQYLASIFQEGLRACPERSNWEISQSRGVCLAGFESDARAFMETATSPPSFVTRDDIVALKVKRLTLHDQYIQDDPNEPNSLRYDHDIDPDDLYLTERTKNELNLSKDDFIDSPSSNGLSL